MILIKRFVAESEGKVDKLLKINGGRLHLGLREITDYSTSFLSFPDFIVCR